MLCQSIRNSIISYRMEDVLKDMSDTASKLARQLSQQCDVSPAVLTDRIQTLARHGVPFREIERTLRSEYGAPVSTPTPPSPRAVLPETLAEGAAIAARTETHFATGTIAQSPTDAANPDGERHATVDVETVWAVGIGPAQDITDVFADDPSRRVFGRTQQAGWQRPQARLETIDGQLGLVLPLTDDGDVTDRSIRWKSFTPVLDCTVGQLIAPTRLLRQHEYPPEPDTTE